MSAPDPAPTPDFTPEQRARHAAGDALAAAEVAWLRAVADAVEDRQRDDDARAPSPSPYHRAECAAFLAYLRTPAPDVHGLAGKLLAAERWATDVAQDGGDAVLLIEALAAIRADVIRLT